MKVYQFELYGFPVCFEIEDDGYFQDVPWSRNCQYVVLKKLEKKYTDFVDMVWRKIDNMR